MTRWRRAPSASRSTARWPRWSPRCPPSTSPGCSPDVRCAGDHGFVPELIRVARASGVAAYVGDGSNRWAAVHRLDAARAFRLALDKADGGTRVHAVAEEGIATRQIAAVIGRRLGVPVASKPADHFGWLGRFFAMDLPTSSQQTRARLGWQPVERGLLADLDSTAYFPG